MIKNCLIESGPPCILFIFVVSVADINDLGYETDAYSYVRFVPLKEIYEFYREISA
jgi:hypothetical protein